MELTFITLFPDHIRPWATGSIIGRACDSGALKIHYRNPRDYTYDRHHKVDDAPYGGQPGMLIRAEPVALAIESLDRTPEVVILTDPAGIPFRQSDAVRLSEAKSIALICGHYEGVDDRIADEFCALRFSIGDYVLTGGELPAMVMADAIVRILPGVLGDPASLMADSHSDGLLSAPNYTVPVEWRGREVPSVLRSGNHAEIAEWRRTQALLQTQRHRPDLFCQAAITEKDLEILRNRATE
jgi:tRNA (guanine37-N1)-methyltransferase